MIVNEVVHGNVLSVGRHLNMNTHPKRTVHSTNVIGHNYMERSYLILFVSTKNILRRPSYISFSLCDAVVVGKCKDDIH